jgi:hypothetical protein
VTSKHSGWDLTLRDFCIEVEHILDQRGSMLPYIERLTFKKIKIAIVFSKVPGNT